MEAQCKENITFLSRLVVMFILSHCLRGGYLYFLFLMNIYINMYFY